MTGAQKIGEYEMTSAQKIDQYEVTFAQKKIDVYRLMDSQKTRECGTTGVQTKKADACGLVDSQRSREYEKHLHRFAGVAYKWLPLFF